MLVEHVIAEFLDVGMHAATTTPCTCPGAKLARRLPDQLFMRVVSGI